MNIFKAREKEFALKERTYVMGILNLTPDSFSDGGDFYMLDEAISRAYEIEREGADILDIGGQSTRPGYKAVSQEEEWTRIKPLLCALAGKIKLTVSVDTFYPYVAERALDIGVQIINDVSGFKNEDMLKIAANAGAGCIVMSNLPAQQVFYSLCQKREQILQFGIKNEQICFDPGIGFGKNHQENLSILKHPTKFCPKDGALLIGASRKRVTENASGGLPPKQRVSATIAAHTLAIAGGADIIRVHDVKDAVQAANMAIEILRER